MEEDGNELLVLDSLEGKVLLLSHSFGQPQVQPRLCLDALASILSSLGSISVRIILHAYCLAALATAFYILSKLIS